MNEQWRFSGNYWGSRRQGKDEQRNELES